MRYRLLFFAALGLAIVAGVAAWVFYSGTTSEPGVQPGTVETAARFTSIKGNVEVKKSGTLRWLDAAMSIVLLQDDLIRTGENAEAGIKFADGTQIALRPESLVTILGSRGSPDSRIARVEPRIDSGAASFQTGARPETDITSPHGRTVPDPETEGRIQVDDGGTALEIHRGGAEVEPETGSAFRLSPNEAVQIDPEGVAGPKTTLPPAPYVMDVPRPPGLHIRSVELRGDQLHLSGKTEPGAALTVNGEPIKVLRDGSFSEHVVLAPGTITLSICATGETGATTEQSLPIQRRGRS
jgi:hypothetical protein